MFCFNTFCVDIAREEHQLSEADYQHMIDEHNLSAEVSMSPLYESLAAKLIDQL